MTGRGPGVAAAGSGAAVGPPAPAALHCQPQLRLWHHHHHTGHCEGGWALDGMVAGILLARSRGRLLHAGMSELSSAACCTVQEGAQPAHVGELLPSYSLPPRPQAGPKISVPKAAADRLFAGGRRLALVARNERPQVTRGWEGISLLATKRPVPAQCSAAANGNLKCGSSCSPAIGMCAQARSPLATNRSTPRSPCPAPPRSHAASAASPPALCATRAPTSPTKVGETGSRFQCLRDGLLV